MTKAMSMCSQTILEIVGKSSCVHRMPQCHLQVFVPIVYHLERSAFSALSPTANSDLIGAMGCSGCNMQDKQPFTWELHRSIAEIDRCTFASVPTLSTSHNGGEKLLRLGATHGTNGSNKL